MIFKKQMESWWVIASVDGSSAYVSLGEPSSTGALGGDVCVLVSSSGSVSGSGEDPGKSSSSASFYLANGNRGAFGLSFRVLERTIGYVLLLYSIRFVIINERIHISPTFPAPFCKIDLSISHNSTTSHNTMSATTPTVNAAAAATATEATTPEQEIKTRIETLQSNLKNYMDS